MQSAEAPPSVLDEIGSGGRLIADEATSGSLKIYVLFHCCFVNDDDVTVIEVGERPEQSVFYRVFLRAHTLGGRPGRSLSDFIPGAGLWRKELRL